MTCLNDTVKNVKLHILAHTSGHSLHFYQRPSMLNLRKVCPLHCPCLPSINPTDPLFLITVSQLMSLAEVFYSIRGKASILSPEARPASWAPETKSTLWKLGRGFLLHQKPNQGYEPQMDPGQIRDHTHSKKSRLKLGKQPLLNQRQPKSSEIYLLIQVGTLYSTTVRETRRLDRKRN